MAENIFEYAVRNKLRFPYKGQISAEDLWDLSVSQLDIVFKTLNSAKKVGEEESLLGKKSKEDEALAIKIEIVKHIFDAKQVAAEARKKAAANAEKRNRLMEIIAQKEDEALSSMSVDELRKMLEELCSLANK